jgi:hypothetical protein
MAAPQALVLENFHNLKQACERLGLSDPKDPEDKRGQKWLRDGVNRPEDGSKGPRFPCTRMAGQLKFSDSQLAEIAGYCANKVDGRSGPRRPRRKTRQLKSAA